MAKAGKPEKRQFSISLPVSLIEEIDTVCAATFITRTAWFSKAAQEKLDNDRAEREKRLQEKLKE